MRDKSLILVSNLINEMPSVHKSSCGEKVELGRNFEAYQEKFRGGHHFSVVLMQTKLLPLSLTTKVRTNFDVVDIRIDPSIVLAVNLRPLKEVKLSVCLPRGCRISQGRRKKTHPRQ